MAIEIDQAALDKIYNTTATALENTSLVNNYRNHLNKIDELVRRKNELTRQTKDMQDILEHQHQLNNALSLKETIFENYKDTVNNAPLVTWLTNVQTWSLDAYRELMSFRDFVTGEQRLIYDIMGADSFSYRLTEDQFLELLTGDLTVYHSMNWSELASKGNLFNLLKLQVADPSKNNDLKNIGTKHNLKEDILYRYLTQHDKFNEGYGNPVEELKQSRLYELYDQLRYSLDWKLADDGRVMSPEEVDMKGETDFFFSQDRESEVDSFIANYISAKMHRDTVAFYRTGDAIADALTIIENKIGGSAVVSISTISNAIDKLNGLNNNKYNQSASALKKRIKAILTYSDQKHKFANEIQKGAKKAAEAAIDAFVETLNSQGFFNKT